jgi:hypothetical protein
MSTFGSGMFVGTVRNTRWEWRARVARVARVAVVTLVGLSACGKDDATPTSTVTDTTQVAQPMSVLGRGDVPDRYTAEVAVRGNIAYTTTWGRRAVLPGNAINVWNVADSVPVLVNSVVLDGAGTTGDVSISDDGRLLVVASERGTANGIGLYTLDDPTHPQFVRLFSSGNTLGGVHTVKLARVSARLYAFLSVNLVNGSPVFPSRLVIVDITDPQSPIEIVSRDMGNPFIHDVYVRDGILFTALWDAGITIWDIGGGGHGGSVAAPIAIGNVVTVGGRVHNAWWYHDAAGARKYLFVGEEGPGIIGSASIGDIHVVDVSDLTAPREIGVYSLAGAGTHNFSMDEPRGVLYAAYYNGGVRALDVRGDLASCTMVQREVDGRCNLRLMGRERGVATFAGLSPYIWGVAYSPPFVFASDMLNGLWKLAAFTNH